MCCQRAHLASFSFSDSFGGVCFLWSRCKTTMGAVLTLRWGWGLHVAPSQPNLIYALCVCVFLSAATEFPICLVSLTPLLIIGCDFSLCSHLTSEMTKSRGELASKDSELLRLRREVCVKASQISQMEEALLHMRNQLDRKSDIGMRWLSM